jgi:hypothetical protein
MTMPGCPAFAVAVLDLVQPGTTAARAGADILATAIAAEIPMDAPSTTLKRVRGHFRRLLSQLQAREQSRDMVESAVAAVFAKAAARDFRALNALD